MIINRSKARIIAMQIIFQIPVHKTTDKVLVETMEIGRASCRERV